MMHDRRVGFLMIFRPLSTQVKLTAQSQRLLFIVYFVEMVTVSVDGAVLDRIGKIMSYVHLGRFLRKTRMVKVYKNITVRLWIVMMKLICPKWIWAKRRLHRWDFEIEEEQKEAMPKAAFQFGVKMQDGRKTRKQNKDKTITNELHKILAKKMMAVVMMNLILERSKGFKPLNAYYALLILLHVSI
ncbi:putative protein RED [Helianthus anomalus]